MKLCRLKKKLYGYEIPTDILKMKFVKCLELFRGKLPY